MVINRFETYCDKYGFTLDKDLSELNRIICKKNFKKLHIDTYLEDPYTLLLRTIESNVVISLEKDRIIIRKNDRNKTTVTNISLESIDNCITKRYDNTRYEIIFTVHNICYKIFVII